jgi:hypothetical protein
MISLQLFRLTYVSPKVSRPLSSRLLLGRDAWTAYRLTSIAVLVVGAAFIFGQFYRPVLGTVSDILSPTIASVTFLIAMLTARKIGVRRNGRLSTVWFSLMLGVFLWFLSEVAWAIYPLVLQISTPYPSVADAFGIVGYFPILVGLALQVSPFREAFEARQVLLVLFVVAAFGLLGLSFLLPVVAVGETFPVLVVSSAYPVLDVIALSVAIPTLLVFAKGTFWKPFLFLVLGIVLALSAHLLSAWTTSNGTYYSGHPLELLFDWGYLSAALGFYEMRKKFAERLL